MTTTVPPSSITAGGCDGYEYVLDTHVTGSGTITATPSRPIYYKQDEISVLATPADADWYFDSWSGAISSVINPDTVTIVDQHSDLTATFLIIPFQTEWTFDTGLESWHREDSYGTNVSITGPGDGLLHHINTGGGWQQGRADYHFPTNLGQRYAVMHDVGATISGAANTISNNFPGLGYAYSGIAWTYQGWDITTPKITLPEINMGIPLDTISTRSQLFGVGNDWQVDTIRIDGIFRGELWDSTNMLRWMGQQYNCTVQIPNAYGYGKLNYVKVFSSTTTFNATAGYMVGATGFGIGQLKVGMTVVSTTKAGLPVWYMWPQGTNDLTAAAGPYTFPIGQRVVLSGTAGRAWIDYGRFKIFLNDSKTGDINNIWIDKVWWTDGTGDHTIVDFGPCPY